MSQKPLHTQYRQSLLILHLIIITLLSIWELSACLGGIAPSRFVLGVLLPIFINLCAHLCARLLVARTEVSDKFKDGTVTCAIFVTAACVSILHRQYPPTLCSYVFPIVLCGFFNNKPLLNRLTAISLVALSISTALLLQGSGLTSSLMANLAVAYVFILIAYFSSFWAMAFSQSNFFARKNQTYLQQQIQLDPMTGLYNHRTFDRDLALAVRAFRQQGTPFCLTIVDIDNFKQVNDTYGHDQGDVVILALCDTLRAICSPHANIYRYGGEEFALIFSNQDSATCTALMEQALQAFRTQTFPFTKHPITFSCGLSQYPGDLSAQDFFVQVDQRLYTAKKTGKNRIVSSPAPNAV